VTAISGSAGWDFRYLRELLSRTPWIELRDPIVVPGVSALAMSGEELLRQDLIILNDLPDEALSVEQWEAISRLVHERSEVSLSFPASPTCSRNTWMRRFCLIHWPRCVPHGAPGPVRRHIIECPRRSSAGEPGFSEAG